MTVPTAFRKTRMLTYINEKMKFFGNVEKITRVLAIVVSYFRVFDEILAILYSFAFTSDSVSRIELFLAVESIVLLVISLMIGLKIKDLYKEEVLSKLFVSTIFNGLFLHIVFGEVNLISLSLSLSFLILHEMIELIQKRFFFSRLGLIVDEDNDVDPSLILMLQRYIEDRVQWITLVSITLALVNLIIYIGVLFTPLFNPFTSTLSVILLFIFGIWMFFTIPSSD